MECWILVEPNLHHRLTVVEPFSIALPPLMLSLQVTTYLSNPLVFQPLFSIRYKPTSLFPALKVEKIHFVFPKSPHSRLKV